jgi:hypothetical protein
MPTSNEILAETIIEKLKEEGLVIKSDTQLVSKLAKGQLKDSDWKIALEEVLNQPATEDETE